jgi:hypothetical protein
MISKIIGLVLWVVLDIAMIAVLVWGVWFTTHTPNSEATPLFLLPVGIAAFASNLGTILWLLDGGLGI